jgi:uracil-DNA glycosylase family 4
VAGWGPLTTDRVIVGEAPGEIEVAKSKQFVGRAGRRLDAALVAVGVERSTRGIPSQQRSRPPSGASAFVVEDLAAGSPEYDRTGQTLLRRRERLRRGSERI